MTDTESIYHRYREIVEGLILAGKTPEDCYKMICEATRLEPNKYKFDQFTEEFSFEIEQAIPVATANVIQKLYKNAMKGSVQAQVAWLYQFAHWGSDVKNTDKNEKEVLLIPADMTREAWDTTATMKELDPVEKISNEK